MSILTELQQAEPCATSRIEPKVTKRDLPECDLARLVEEARSLTGADGAAIALCDEQGVLCRASTGNAPSVGSRLRVESGLTGECYRSGEVVWCHDMDNDPSVNQANAKRLQSRSALILPIRPRSSGRSTLGVIEVLSSRTSAFSYEHVAILHRLAKQISADVSATAASNEAELQEQSLTWQQQSVSGLVSKPPAGTPKARLESEAQERERGSCTPVSVLAQLQQDSPLLAPLKTASAEQTLLVKGSDSESVLKPKHTAVGAARDLIRRCSLALSLKRKNGPRKEISGSMVVMGVLLFLVAGSVWWLFVHAQQTPIARQTHSSSSQASEITSRPLLTEESPKQLHFTNEKSGRRVKSAGTTAYKHTASERREPTGPVRQLPAGQTQISEAEAPQLALMSAASLPNLSSPAPLPVAPPKSQIVPAQLVHRIPPEYPEAARRQRLSGQVLLKAAITKYGTVGDVHWVNGNPVFRNGSIAAIKQWRFKPANLNGEPVESDLEVILQFSPKAE